MNSISTQAKHWIFSSEELSKKRISAFEDSKIRVSQAWKLENEITKNSKKVEFLTLNDQMNLISFFETKIVVYCKVFKFDKNVKATALMLFKRFFIKGNAMEHDPARILITCLFLGSKIEHQPVALAEFLTKIPKSPIKESQMVELELIVSKELNFELMIHHPFWPLHGFFLDIQTFIHETDLDIKQETLQALFIIYTKATDVVVSTLLTDLPLLYSPSQIAFGCLVCATREDKIWSKELLEKYAQWRFKDKNILLLFEIAEIVQNVLSNYKKISQDDASKISKKQKECFSPQYDPSSYLYSQNQKKEETVNELTSPFD